MTRRCIGCGYYEEELDAKPASPYGCEGGDGYTGHVLVDVDEEGMVVPSPEEANEACS